MACIHLKVGEGKMNKKIIILSAFVFTAVSANAQIRVYDPNTGKDMSLESMVDTGLLEVQTSKSEKYNKPSGNIKNSSNSSSSLNSITSRQEKEKSGEYTPETHPDRYFAPMETRETKRKAAIAKFNEMVKEEAEHNKNIEDRKIHGLGTVVVFADMKTLERSDAKVLNAIKDLEGVTSAFYTPQARNMLAYYPMSMKMRGELDVSFKFDSGGRNARRLHVDSWPQIIYIDPEKNMSRYAMTTGGLKALRLRLGEVEAYKLMKQQQEAEAQRSKNKKY